MEMYNMLGQVCLVTGATSGIGLATATGLARMGATVLITARNTEKGERACTTIKTSSGNNDVDFLIADLSSQQEIRRLATDVRQRYPRLHVLVNNAGTMSFERRLSVDGIEMTLAVNHLAPFLLTNLLLEPLQAAGSARVVTVSSDAQNSGYIDFDNLQGEKEYRGFRAYAQSKLCNVLFTYALARRLRGTGVTVNCLHPGVVATNIWPMARGPFLTMLLTVVQPLFKSPEQGARTSLFLAAAPQLEGVSGRYYKNSKEKRSAKISYDEAVQERLWQVSEQLCELTLANHV